jgi:hypothetical protein
VDGSVCVCVCLYVYVHTRHESLRSNYETGGQSAVCVMRNCPVLSQFCRVSLCVVSPFLFTLAKLAVEKTASSPSAKQPMKLCGGGEGLRECAVCGRV